MYQFQRAPTFTSGSDITAANINKLCKSLNQHLTSGVGDPSRRIHLYNINLMRNIRNPDDTLFPAENEALFFYNHLKSEGLVWPDAEAGEPQGANVASPLPQWLFGSVNLEGEANRLSALLNISPLENTTKAIWDLAKEQRGIISIADELEYVPFLSASNEFYKVVAAPWQPFLKAPGGMLPSPPIVGECDAGSGGTFPSYGIFFTNLESEEITSFPGSCCPDFGGSADDVLYIQEFALKWVVIQCNGTRTEFPKDKYIIGPYTGNGRLFKPDGDQIGTLMLNSFNKEFKSKNSFDALHISASSSPYPITGSDCYNILSQSFDYQSWINRPLQLAPSWGQVIGDELVSNYPSTSLSTNQVEGTMFPLTYNIHSGFIVGGYYFKGVNLAHTVDVGLFCDGNLVTTFTVQTGSASDPLVYDDCNTLTGTTSGSITFRLMDDLDINSPSGSIYVEFSEIKKQYPTVNDLYCFLRCNSALGIIEVDENNDQFGTEMETPIDMYNNYQKYGGILNVNGAAGIDQPIKTINTNPIYNALKNYLRSYSRYFDRNQLLGYEVADGKSILYFKKNVDDNPDLFGWDGMVDPFNSGSVNGIKENAPSGSWSNEWILDMSFNSYRNEETSIWKPSAYSDYFIGNNRCLLLNTFIPTTSNIDIFNFLQPGGSSGPLLAPEYGVTWLNYYRNVNSNSEINEPSGQFYESCRVFPEPYSVQDIREVNGEIKVTFNKRFLHYSGAPATIPRDLVTWSNNTSIWSNTGEFWNAMGDFRTDENAIMSYLYYQQTGTNAQILIGDMSANNNYSSYTDQFYGSIFPRFNFLKLIPKPYQGNATNDCVCKDINKTVISSELLIQMETYIKAMCSGYIDGFTGFDCTIGEGSFDYTFENLCFQAFGGNRITFPERTDNAKAYGSYCTMKPFSSTLNQLSSCINLLNKARLPLPFKLETRTTTYRNDAPYGANIYLNGSTCNSGKLGAILFGTTGPSAVTVDTVGEWEELEEGLGGFQFGGGCGTGWGGSCTEDSSEFILTTTRTAVEYRFKLVDDNALKCLSSDLQDNFLNGTNAFFANVETFNEYWTAEQVSTSGASFQTCLCLGGELGPTDVFWNGSIGYNANIVQSDVFECRLLSSGIIDAGPNPHNSTDLFMCKRVACDPDTQSSTNSTTAYGVTVATTDTSVVVIPLVD